MVVVVEVVVVLGDSDVPDGTEEAVVVVVEEVAALAVAGLAVSVSDAGGEFRSSTTFPAAAVVVVVAVAGGTEAAAAAVVTASTEGAVATDSGLLSLPPEEQPAATSPKTAATAAETHFACLMAESLSSENKCGCVLLSRTAAKASPTCPMCHAAIKCLKLWHSMREFKKVSLRDRTATWDVFMEPREEDPVRAVSVRDYEEDTLWVELDTGEKGYIKIHRDLPDSLEEFTLPDKPKGESFVVTSGDVVWKNEFWLDAEDVEKVLTERRNCLAV